MEAGMVFEGSNNMAAFLQNDRLTSSQDLDSLRVSNSSHGENQKAAETKPFSCGFDDDYDKCDHQPEKKRRLTADQVQFLERSFEEENKLEPERKMQLAKELNLQPRQVAIWFQNRRARYKTKRLERDYDVLKSRYDGLKSDFDTLRNNNDKLKLEVQMLVEKLLQTEKSEKDSCTFSFSTSELAKSSPKRISTRNWSDMPKVTTCKQEYANSISGKSDVIDSESPNFTDGHHSSFLEPADSSNMFENQSDFSPDEEDNFSKNILRCPKIEYESYIDQNEGSLGYPLEDQPFWLWP